MCTYSLAIPRLSWSELELSAKEENIFDIDPRLPSPLILAAGEIEPNTVHQTECKFENYTLDSV